MRKITQYIMIFLCINLCCSYFNNLVEPTYILDYHCELEGYNIVVMPPKVGIQKSFGFVNEVDKDTPTVVLYLKIVDDFSKIYHDLSEKNSTYIYDVFRDSVDSAGIFYRIIFSSVKDDTTDTTYFNTVSNKCIEITLNNELMGYPEKFLWQTKIREFEPFPIPPVPYAYVVSEDIITD